jgi:hypothetical protein
MTTWALLAPGPSASAELAEKLRGFKLGAVNCAYQLAPWADFIAAADSAWWRKYPDALSLPARKYCMATVEGVKRVSAGPLAVCNSGVTALECAKLEGATKVLLCGFDMHGTHFHGPYTNGLRNTAPHQRTQHCQQFADWAKVNKKIEVFNCTPSSALRCFPMARIEDFEASIPEPAADQAGQGRDVHSGIAA